MAIKTFIGEVKYDLSDIKVKKYILDRYIGTTDFNNVWGQLIKKSIIKNVRFDLEYAMDEDFKFNLELLNNTKIIYTIEDCLYHYVYNTEGINFNDSYEKTKIKIQNICKLYDWLYSNYNKKTVCISFLKGITPYFLKINEYDWNEQKQLQLYIITQPIFYNTRTLLKNSNVPKNKYYYVYKLVLHQNLLLIKLLYVFVFKPIKIFKRIIYKIRCSK